jgi:ubiquinone/menaquinone biosynthesis C-methylase UbiE
MTAIRKTNSASVPHTPPVETPDDTRAAWNRLAPGYDKHVTGTHLWLGEQGLRRVGLQPGMRFLDVAAGSGALSIPAAQRGATVLATDLSPEMLRQLEWRTRGAGVTVETRVMDGHALELEDATFDVCGSQFGVMLFPDMPRGVREMVRVVRPGGRVLLTVYGNPAEVEFLQFFIRAIRTAVPGFPGLPTDPPPLPFQLQDPAKVKRVLAGSGLQDVRVETLTEQLVFERGEQLWDWLTNSNPVGVALVADLTPKQKVIVMEALDRQIRERAAGSGKAALTNPINIGTATKR